MSIEEAHLAPARVPDARSAPVGRIWRDNHAAAETPGIVQHPDLGLFHRTGRDTNERIGRITSGEHC